MMVPIGLAQTQQAGSVCIRNKEKKERKIILKSMSR